MVSYSRLLYRDKGLQMDWIMGSFGIVFGIIFFIPFVAIPIFIVITARRVFKFQSGVFNRIDPALFQKIDQAEKPNKHYVKTRCDNCGAKCTNAADISPSGDLKCAYCDTWFNVLRT